MSGKAFTSGYYSYTFRTWTEAGIIISIMIDDAEATKKLIIENGGKIIYSATLNPGEVIMHFTYPAGNVMGIYQEAR